MIATVTIRHIAGLAGVSIATVSRVLNQKPDVDPATRERILRIVDEQQFVPSVAGAGLAGGRTGLLGMLVPSLTWPILASVLGGVAAAVEQTSYELVLYSLSHKGSRSRTIKRIVDAKLIDGLVAVYPTAAARPGEPARGDRELARQLRDLYERGVPVVVIDDQGTHERIPWISPDNRQGALEAVRHLIALGHRRIAHVAGPPLYQCARDRQAGYRAALAAAALPPDPALEVVGDFTAAGGRAATAPLFALAEPPTAIFAANDDMARGVLAAVEERGLGVPEDLAVAGFDDAGPSAFTRPPLTTVRQPFADMGHLAAQTLLTLVAAPRPAARGPSRAAAFARHPASPWEMPAPHVQLGTQLIVRESTAAPRGAAIRRPVARPRSPAL